MESANRESAPGNQPAARLRRRRVCWIAAGLAVLAGLIPASVGWWSRRALEAARSEIARGQIAPARTRLERLQWLPAALRSPEADFLLGMTLWSAGEHAKALATFARIPAGSEFEPRAAMFQAEAALRAGKLRAAEERLQHVLDATGGSYGPALDWLERVYRLGSRFDEVRAVIRRRLKRAEKPVTLLKELWRLDRGTVPLEGIRAGLDEASARAGDGEDDRIWLGRARLALLSGRPVEARFWLDRCLLETPGAASNPRGGADEAVWRCWLDWAAAASQPAEAAGALERLGLARLTRAELWSWRGWLLRQRGDRAGEADALRRGLALEPGQPRLLERLAELSLAAGDLPAARALRERKAVVDQAVLDYDQRIKVMREDAAGPALLELARLAEAAGRLFDAAAWADLAARQGSPGDARHVLADRLRQLSDNALAPACEEQEPPPSWTELAAAAPSPAAVPAAEPGTGPETGPAPGLAPGAARPARRAVPHLVDEAAASGLVFTFQNGETPLRQMPEPLSGGLALLDYDGDGWLDVFLAQGGPFPPRAPQRGDRLFRNRGDGSFLDATDAAGLPALTQGYGHGVAVGDIDNDGDPDLVVSRWGGLTLYRNDRGRFADATAAWGLDGPAGRGGWPTSMALADLDGDGDLDLYVCHYLAWDPDNPRLCRNPRTNAYVSCSPLQLPALPDRLYRNDGGRFVDATTAAGIVDRDGRGLGVLAAQLDDDMKVDLFVANDMTANELHHNLGGFRFEPAGHAAGVAGNAEGGYQAGMGIACGDVDGDGRVDLAVTNFYGEGLSLYRNHGGGFFADCARESGLAQASRYHLGFGVAFLDADNDGFLDLATANGHLDDLGDTPYRMSMQLFQGGEKGSLRDITQAVGPAVVQPRLGRALAAGDLDHDGRVDLLVIEHNAPLVYLRNRTEAAGHWVLFRLEGTRSNRDAVGAIITLRAGSRTQVRQRFGGGSYQAASDARVHFGLGSASLIDEIEVRWPSGAVGRWKGLKADTGYLLLEDDPEPRRLAGFAR